MPSRSDNDRLRRRNFQQPPQLLFAFYSPLRYAVFEMAKRLYLVAYDLSLPLPYESLKARLTTMGAQQLLDRVWAVLMSESADEIKRTLRSFVDDKDRILVAEVGHDWASRRALFRLGELIEPAGGPARALWRQRWRLEAPER